MAKIESNHKKNFIFNITKTPEFLAGSELVDYSIQMLKKILIVILFKIKRIIFSYLFPSTFIKFSKTIFKQFNFIWMGK